MDKIKVAFYSDTYLPAVDGVVTSMLNFKKELEKRGHKVYIFASGDSKAKAQYSKSDVYISRGVSFPLYKQYKVALFPYKHIAKLSRLDVDIVHAQTPFAMGLAGMLAAKLLNKPIIGSFHTLLNDKVVIDTYYPKNKYLKQIASRYLWEYIKFFFNRCDANIAPTRTIEKMLSREGVKNVFVVENCVDTISFNPKVNGSDIREKLGIKKEEKMVLYLGRISREKRIEVLLHTAKILQKKDKKIKFIIAGTGPANDYYQGLASKLGLTNTRFGGFIEKKMLPKYYAACNVLCLPSTFETQGIVCLEAMAAGKGVVGADYMALSEIIKNGYNGEKFVPGDYKGCASRIEKVLNNPDKYKKGAIKTANLFSIQKTTDKLIEVYNIILSKN